MQARVTCVSDDIHCHLKIMIGTNGDGKELTRLLLQTLPLFAPLSFPRSSVFHSPRILWSSCRVVRLVVSSLPTRRNLLLRTFYCPVPHSSSPTPQSITILTGGCLYSCPYLPPRVGQCPLRTNASCCDRGFILRWRAVLPGYMPSGLSDNPILC